MYDEANEANWESGGWYLHPPPFPDLWEIDAVWALLGKHPAPLDNNKDFPSCSLPLAPALLEAWLNSSQRTITASATPPCWLRLLDDNRKPRSL